MEIYRNIENKRQYSFGNCGIQHFITVRLIKEDSEYFWIRHDNQMLNADFIEYRDNCIFTINGRFTFPFYEEDL